jgi:hypothetical protein
MKTVRVLLYIVILVALFFVPLQAVEIANLKPIQAVWLTVKDGEVLLLADTEDRGSGATVDEAFANMKNNSSGIVYLDTAQYLFVSEPAEQEIFAIAPYLKNSVLLCRWDGQGDIREVVKFADSHKIGVKLKHLNNVVKLPEMKLQKLN